MKKSTFRARSISEQSSVKDLFNNKETSDFVLVRIQVETDFTTMKIPALCAVEDVLRHVSEKYALNYDDYTIEFPDGSKADLDRTLQHYLQSARVAELRVFKGPKTFSTVVIMENGEEVLILSTAKEK